MVEEAMVAEEGAMVATVEEEGMVVAMVVGDTEDTVVADEDTVEDMVDVVGWCADRKCL